MAIITISRWVPVWVCPSVERCLVGETSAWGLGPRTSGREARGSRCGRESRESGCDRSNPWCRWTCTDGPSPTESPPSQPSTITDTSSGTTEFQREGERVKQTGRERGYTMSKVWGPWYCWLGLPSQPLRQPVSAGCTRWPCGRRLWLVTKAH